MVRWSGCRSASELQLVEDLLLSQGGLVLGGSVCGGSGGGVLVAELGVEDLRLLDGVGLPFLQDLGLLVETFFDGGLRINCAEHLALFPDNVHLCLVLDLQSVVLKLRLLVRVKESLFLRLHEVYGSLDNALPVELLPELPQMAPVEALIAKIVFVLHEVLWIGKLPRVLFVEEQTKVVLDEVQLL